jgi:hypothetical protein
MSLLISMACSVRPSSMSHHELIPCSTKNKTQPFLFPPFNWDVDVIEPGHQKEGIVGAFLETDLDLHVCDVYDSTGVEA